MNKYNIFLFLNVGSVQLNTFIYLIFGRIKIYLEACSTVKRKKKKRKKYIIIIVAHAIPALVALRKKKEKKKLET